jgi:hypothetical protein
MGSFAVIGLVPGEGQALAHGAIRPLLETLTAKAPPSLRGASLFDQESLGRRATTDPVLESRRS